MKHLKRIAPFLFAITLIAGCQDAVDDTIEEVKEDIKEELSDEIEDLDLSPENVREGSQTVGERIDEIKQLYAQIQASPNQNKNCINKSKTVINYDIMEEGFPMTNKAKSCQLEDDLKYEQIELNGYEWGETTSFYYHEGKRFFVYTSGGAEGCGYEYRIYYNTDGEIIRMLEARNDCDGKEVSASVEVQKEGQKEEILNTIEHAEKELKELLAGK
ncbi:MAG: hypothetical protein HWE22_19145 [Flavobacteriales bacterium]|nr:hypothetical protein [Flavobacteriales bacterium]